MRAGGMLSGAAEALIWFRPKQMFMLWRYEGEKKQKDKRSERKNEKFCRLMFEMFLCGVLESTAEGLLGRCRI